MDDDLPESPFKDFKLHDTWFDWGDETITPRSIGRRLMGSVSYWDDPVYGEVVNKEGVVIREAMHPHEIEREILFEAGRDQWAYESAHGKPYYQHFLTLMALLDENTDITPTIADATKLFCMSFTYGIKTVNLIGSQNSGKCLKFDTLVRMFDGSTKRADEVSVGDRLMGPDSTERNVLNTCSGNRRMFTITPKVGEPFTVTENHLVTVVCKRGKKNNGGKTWSSRATPGAIYDIEAQELASMPLSRLDNLGLLSARVEYPERVLPVDPYIYGLWLGDGAKIDPRITSHVDDTPIHNACIEWWKSQGNDVHISKTNNTYCISFTKPGVSRNSFRRFIVESVNSNKSKFILNDYLKSTVEHRMQLLAGIIDTDGSLEGTYFSISCSDPDLMDGYQELANSLGFRTSRKRKKMNYILKDGTLAQSERLSVCGDIHTIPTRLPRKQAKPKKLSGRGIRKNGVTGFTISESKDTRYAGFEVDGDSRFLLSDYTITHNSAGSVRIAFCCFYIDPEFTSIYVLNPYSNTSESTVWGDILEMWDNICTTHPHDAGEKKTVLFPKGFVYQDRYITAIPKLAKAGFIKVVDAKEASKLKGNKTKKGGEGARGLILHIFDEVNEVRNFAYLAVLPNLQSQNFMAITSQNFKSEDDVGGLLCAPTVRYEKDVARYKDLEVDRDHLWSSDYMSMTLRFDGARSANIQARRKVYWYLFHQGDWDRLAAGGLESPNFYSQARSFPIRGDSENNKVLSQSKISGSRYTDPWFTVTGTHTRVSFCDPAFGGQDDAKWGFAVFGPAIVVDGLGGETTEMIFQVTHHFETLKLVKEATYNHYWFARMEAVGIDVRQVTIGAEVSVEDQIAIQCAEKNQEHGVSPDNFGYDFSMREEVGPSMSRYVGTSCVPFGYNRKPEGYKLNSLNTTTDEYCEDRISELCYLTADLFNSRQFRGGEFCREAIIQLSRTRVEEIGKSKKKKCEDKKSYKHQWKYSPDDRDVIVGLVGMACRRGMVTKSLKSDVMGDTYMQERIRGKFRIKKAHRI